MLVALALLISGLAAMSVVLAVRWVESLLWRRQLVGYRLQPPRKLTHDQVSAWLAALGAVTRHIPVVIEVVATDHGIAHFMVMPRFHARVLLSQVRTMLPGTTAEHISDYLLDDAVIRAA